MIPGLAAARATLCGLANRSLLRLAACLVPRRARAEWLQEWHAEFWQVRHTCAPPGASSWSGERIITRFCLGAFQDALCLRQAHPTTRLSFSPARGSALHCLLSMSAIAITVAGAGLLIPGVLTRLEPARFATPPDVALIHTLGNTNETQPTITIEQFRSWRRERHLFSVSAFYQVFREPLAQTPRSATISVALTSPALFHLLNFPSETSRLPALILGDELWRTRFNQDPQIVGQILRIGSRQARVVAIAPPRSWRLPGAPDVWFVEAEPAFDPHLQGFVLARLSPTAPRDWYGSTRHTYARAASGTSETLPFDLLAERNKSPWPCILFSICLAFLAVPATTPLSLGEYQGPPAPARRSATLRRLTFLSAKVLLLLLITACCSLDLACLRSTFDWRTSEYLLLLSSFLICLFGLRWVIRDQRQRCPVCLGRLTHPARVGHPSRNFLAWNGTELMCADGHGLLHVPEIPMSWFSTQRWLYLDPSWDILFPEKAIP